MNNHQIFTVISTSEAISKYRKETLNFFFKININGFKGWLEKNNYKLNKHNFFGFILNEQTKKEQSLLHFFKK